MKRSYSISSTTPAPPVMDFLTSLSMAREMDVNAMDSVRPKVWNEELNFLVFGMSQRGDNSLSQFGKGPVKEQT